jgi:hypothetical protein
VERRVGGEAGEARAHRHCRRADLVGAWIWRRDERSQGSCFGWGLDLARIWLQNFIVCLCLSTRVFWCGLTSGQWAAGRGPCVLDWKRGTPRKQIRSVYFDL